MMAVRDVRPAGLAPDRFRCVRASLCAIGTSAAASGFQLVSRL